MAIFDKLRGKSKEKTEETEKKQKKEKDEKKKERQKKIKEEGQVTSHRVLKGLHITEKTVALEDKNQYVFKVNKNCNKKDVKKAVEATYGVDVVNVRTVSVPRKRRRTGRTLGWKKGYKKAVVRIKEGQNIETI